MKPIRSVILVTVFMLLTAFGVQSQTETSPLAIIPRTFAIFEHDLLILNVPTFWQHQVKQTSENDPVDIMFTSEQDGGTFVFINARSIPTGEVDLKQPAKLKEVVNLFIEKELPLAVEKEIPAMECKGPEATGYYFLITYKKPEIKEFPCVLYAFVSTGDLVLICIALAQTKDSPVIAATITALQQATQRKPEAVFTVKERVPVPGEDWQIFFDCPELSDKQQSLASDQSRYTLEAKSNRFNISVLVEKPKNKKRTHKDCAKFYRSKIKSSRNNKIDKQSNVLFDTSRYYRVQYDTITDLEGRIIRRRHVHYYISFQDKWLDVHISITEPNDADEAIFSIFDQSLRCGY